jgi:hypothetical protein
LFNFPRKKLIVKFFQYHAELQSYFWKHRWTYSLNSSSLNVIYALWRWMVNQLLFYFFFQTVFVFVSVGEKKYRGVFVIFYATTDNQFSCCFVSSQFTYNTKLYLLTFINSSGKCIYDTTYFRSNVLIIHKNHVPLSYFILYIINSFFFIYFII